MARDLGPSHGWASNRRRRRLAVLSVSSGFAARTSPFRECPSKVKGGVTQRFAHSGGRSLVVPGLGAVFLYLDLPSDLRRQHRSGLRAVHRQALVAAPAVVGER
jgi:hypothetical protein